jgi:hypothetical protein
LLIGALLLICSRAHGDGMGMAIMDDVLRTGFAMVGTVVFGLLTLVALILTLALSLRIRAGHPVHAGRPSPSRAPFVVALIAAVVAGLWQLATLLIAPEGVTWIYVGTLLNLAVAVTAMVKARFDLARGRRTPAR